MTTLTIEGPVNLPKTHFRSIGELAKFVAQWQFEEELEESIKNGMNTPTSEFIRI